MKVRDALTRAQQLASFSVWKARTISRVAMQTGMHSTLRAPGAKVLVSELVRGKTGPSTLFRFHAENNPYRAAVINPRGMLGAGDARREGPASTGLAGDRVYSYRELNDTIDRLGLAMHRWGIGPERGALVMLKNRPEFLIIQPAIARIGGAAVSVSWRSTIPELAYVAEHSGAGALFFDADLADMIHEAAPRLGIPRERMVAVGGPGRGFPTLEEVAAERGAAPDLSEAGAVVMYTSGTTGKPKGAVRTFTRDAIAGTLAFIGETPMRVGDVHLAVCPLYHATAFGFTGMTFLVGGTVVVLPEFRPELFLEAIQRYRVATTAVVPTMLHRVLELGAERIRSYDTSSLRAIFSGGAPLPGQLAIDVMNVLGDKVYNFYGSTETGVVTVASPADLRASPGTIGHAVSGVEIRLIDDAGRDCAVGEVGELYTRSTLLVTGYHKDPDATRQSTLEGYFSVGDLARRDARGCYFIEGRKRDLIISGGVNVYPAEVEAVLHEHPGVAEAAVVGVPDREWGERVRAFVVLRLGADMTEDELRAHCRARLAGPKVPRDVVFLEELPRNPTGKVLKRELARWEAV